MGFRYRRSVKILPGVRVNFNKKSTGITIGGKYGKTTINSNGRVTNSINTPIKGLSYSETTNLNKRSETTNFNKRKASRSSGASVAPKVSSPTAYKVSGIIAMIVAIIIVPLSLLLMIGDMVGIGLFFCIFAIGLFFVGKSYLKKGKQMSQESKKTEENC